MIGTLLDGDFAKVVKGTAINPLVVLEMSENILFWKQSFKNLSIHASIDWMITN
jgi:hypothetical protein